MCGIFGVFGSILSWSAEDIDRQFEYVSFRGPDGKGHIALENCVLGHCLLAIQDPGNASQPMTSKSGRKVISYNGEIYNLKELFRKFDMGELKTKSDTEFLLELVDKYGFEVVNELEGMFAFAIYDILEKKLTLGRDRFGEKPLFYRPFRNKVEFSSNPRALLSQSDSFTEASLRNIAHYFKYQYLPEGETLFEEIQQLKPGSLLTFDLDQNTTETEIAIPELSTPTSGEYSEFRKIFANAVENSMVSDVGLGLALSGGVDSTITLLEMKKIRENIETFTLCFENSHDLQFARKAAHMFGTKHHEIIIKDADLPSLIDYVLRNQPLPFGDSSVIATYALARYAKTFVKVLISGDGADELFSGYEYYRKYGQTRKMDFKGMLGYIKNGIEIQVLEKFRGTKEFSRRKRRKELAFALGITNPRQLWNEDLAAESDVSLRRLGFSNEKISKVSRTILAEFRDIQSVMSWDRKTYLPGDILWKADTAGMMASLEIRTPFLNSHIVSWANKVAFDKNFSKQKMFENIYDGEIPQEFFRRRKQGFGAPIERWFSLPSVNEYVDSILMNPRQIIYNLIDFKGAVNLSKRNAQTRWNLLALALWLDENE